MDVPSEEKTAGFHVVKDLNVVLLVDYSNMIHDAVAFKEEVVSYVKAYLDFVGWKGLRLEVDIRLYDGWDMMEDDGRGVLSRNAQEVCAVMASTFPIRYGPCLIRVELARSLASQPALLLKHTFRRRQRMQKVSVEKVSDFCCDDARKMGPFLVHLVKKGRCFYCGEEATRIISVAEQKMVDTMMALDIVHYGRARNTAIVVASDDDDIIPAVLEIAMTGRTVYHLKKKKSLAYNDYVAIAGPNYKTIMIEE